MGAVTAAADVRERAIHRKPIQRAGTAMHVPAIMCLWAMGVGAILAEHENLLARLLLDPMWKPLAGVQTPQPAVRCLNPAGRVIP